MTLRMQLNAVIISVLVLSFIGSISINIINSQHFLSEQLTSHAQDTATSLGLSLSDPILNDENIVVEATINAIFDRGFYKHITLEDINGNIEYQRINHAQPEQVPLWFVDLFELTAPEQKTMIDTGWTIGGILKVQSHTGLAYAQLWKSAKDITYATFVIFMLALFLAYLVLIQIYKPIAEISLQAEAVQQRQFILIDKLPVAGELKSFVLAMNKMISNIKNTFEELTQATTETHREAYIDEQTGIENRRSFVDTMDSHLAESANHRGHLLMARITGLTELNKELGYQAGDNLVNQLVSHLTTELNSSNAEINKDVQAHKLFRISGSEFCLIIEQTEQQKLTEHVTQLITQINTRMTTSCGAKTIFGLVHFESGEDFGNLMFELDMATNNALENSVGYTIQETKKESDFIGSAKNLKSIFDQVLAYPDKHINLIQQTALCCGERQAFDLELFATFTYQERSINTADLFAIASLYNQTGRLDLTIIKLILSQFNKLHWQGKKIAINLSRLTFTDNQCMTEICQLIKQSGHGEALVIGFTEDAILGDLEESKQKIADLNQAGCTICINRFGSSIESLKYMMEIRPALVKLSPSYTRNIDKKLNNVQMASAFIRMAHGLDITVIAQCIETEAELNTLQNLNIDALQGYAIDKPKPV
ncbi:EAL domain-containing protein [Psychromonas sp. KJ10-10]|uniref:bifunctional diguanylate cyclase/phosphodiesterase n=1 Tax=Psychromonas sp. KJ10-10 TaxID=3391823 RepID=UPI0039B4EDF6